MRYITLHLWAAPKTMNNSIGLFLLEFLQIVIMKFLWIFPLIIFNRADWPANADFNAMDVWQTACYLTVFLSVIEFCAVIFLTETSDWEEKLIGKPKVDIQNGKINSKVKIAFFINQTFFPPF